MDEETQKLLFSTRRNYIEDCQREKFHLDAYAGTGGFSGAIKAAPSSYWGWAADAYSDSEWALGISKHEHSADTYLDRFDREDASKFERRRRVVHYENHVEPCVDIPLSYLRRKPLIRQNAEPLTQWMTDATGDGETWDDLVMRDVLLRGVVTGMCPVMFDMPSVPSVPGMPERTRQDDIEQGIVPRAIPLFGLNLLAFGQDDKGGVEWARVRFDYCDQPDPLGEAKQTVEIRTLEKRLITLYTFVVKNGKTTHTGTQVFKNPFGVVPLAIFRPKPMPGDPVRGISMIQNIASENRRLFNLHSELDEHIRKSVFSFLQVPSKSQTQAGRVVIGNGAALTIDPESKQPYAWVSPTQDVAQVIEKRAENTVAAIYAMARLAFARGQIVSAAASGVSRQYEFESTNRSVSDIAGFLAKFDQAALNIVAKLIAPAAPKVLTTAAKDFGIEDIEHDLAVAETAARARVGARVIQLIREKLASLLVPNMSPEDRQIIQDQIAALAESESRAQMQSDALANMGGAFPDGNVPTANGEGAESVDLPDAATPELDAGAPVVEGAEATIEAASKVEGGTVAVAALAKDPSKNLNAGQVESLVLVVEKVAAGAFPIETGVALLCFAYQCSVEDARAMLEPIEAERKKKPQPTEPPAGQAPPFTSNARPDGAPQETGV